MPSKRSSRLLKILAGAVADADEVFQLEGRLERFTHFWALVVRQFIRHRCPVRASALSYSTLLALIPLLVVALNVTSTFLSAQNESKLTQFVEGTVASLAPSANIPTNTIPAGTNTIVLVATNAAAATNENGEIDTNAVAAMVATNTLPIVTINTQGEVARTIHDLVQKASSGTLGVTGFILLLFTAISLLRGIEETFNDIWGVTRSRNWYMQFLLYWMIISLGPLLLAAALGVMGTGYMENTKKMMASSHLLAPLAEHLAPMAILSVTMGLFYKFTPNTKVELGAAMIGGIFSGISWHVYNQLSFLLVAKAMSASKFYGGVFLIVLLMGGLYVLWLILLFGAQIAYAFQNRAAYVQERLAENVNHRGREFVALRIMTFLGRRFQEGQRPATVPEISAELAVPSRLTQTVLRTLVATRLVTETCGAEAAFVPARPLDAINAHDILMAMRTGTGQELPVCDLPELSEIYGEFARIEQAERSAASGVTLQALANRTMPRLRDGDPNSPQKQVTLPAPLINETEKTYAGAVVVEKPPVVEPAEQPKPPAFPEKIEPPELPSEDTQAAERHEEEPRRETARPEQDMDFPL